MKSTGLICLGAALFAAATFACAATPRADVSPDELKKIEAALPATAPAKPAKPRKILVFDRTEGFRTRFDPRRRQGLRTDGQEDRRVHRDGFPRHGRLHAGEPGPVRCRALQQHHAIEVQRSQAARQALLDFIKGGKGFIGIHAASDNFPTWPEAVEMIGGQFNGHPWTAGGSKGEGWAIKVDDPAHVLNKSFGGKGFILKDEIYQIKGPYSRDTHRVLLSLDMSQDRNHVKPNVGRQDGDNAISWSSGCGDGRVFYCSLGHNKEIYWNKAVLQHYLAGIQWALGDLKVDETPSAKLAKQPEPGAGAEVGPFVPAGSSWMGASATSFFNAHRTFRGQVAQVGET